MSYFKLLYKASALFFFVSAGLSKLRYIPFPLISVIVYPIALSIGLIGYLLWLIGSYYYPEEQKKYKSLSCFTNIRTCEIIAAVIGAMGIILCLFATLSPLMGAIGAWGLALSNVFWLAGQLIKIMDSSTPRDNESPWAQVNYFLYIFCMLLVAIVVASAATAIVVNPLSAISTMMISSLVCTGIGLVSFLFWINSNAGTEEILVSPVKVENVQDMSKSVDKISEDLIINRLSSSNYSDDHVYKPLFEPKVSKKSCGSSDSRNSLVI